MTHSEPDSSLPGDESTPGLEFFTRVTGVTGTVSVALSVHGETFRGVAKADLDPDDIGSGFARLTGTAARMLNSSAGGQFEELFAGLEEELREAAAKAENPGNENE
ncbi:hypothetical protein [Streptomyces violaceusniger]|uniref:Uncharacterized protein n=1 Tax=Streptomyces violaceusniger (strain Tu 4113) TaxID=653045 RepID=G2PHX0_STRV4|nr:hypothetical protein [Streptomyces violaceusniger]AEM88921.1 hypothetical protein Strvi_0146 [Streptomyces violaceusniger Tu 4113]